MACAAARGREFRNDAAASNVDAFCANCAETIPPAGCFLAPAWWSKFASPRNVTMRTSKKAPASTAKPVTRRRFLQTSVATALAVSFEERALLAAPAAAVPAAPPPAAAPLVAGKIGAVQISRLICGGNLISGYAHSRDLIYVSTLLKHYFSEEKIFETWARCEQQGINTMVASSSDPRCASLYQKYVRQGGKIQYIAQVNPREDDLTTSIRLAADAGAVGAFLLGNIGDQWARSGAVGRIGEVVDIIKQHGLIAGVAGHALRTVMAVEKAGIASDFYVKTLHHDNYWSKRRPDQNSEVIDNYRTDNYWCMDATETIAYMAKVKRPWIAYKVLAAGAITPRDGFRYAFENGADFALVGMFDFQVAADAALTRDILASNLTRARSWMA